METPYNIKIGSTEQERMRRADFSSLLFDTIIPKEEAMNNLGLYMSRQSLSRILFMHELYKKIINIHGIVIEFGVRYGQNLALFSNFRGMYEPFNYNRKIIGFDTFKGFASVNKKNDINVKEGDYSVPEDYEKYLEQILSYHESESPIPHKKKYELIKGDATKTLEEYLKKHPETVVALAYFDFDIYEPTKRCLELIKPHLVKGAVIGFDELNDNIFQGETIAFQEVFGLNNYRLERIPISPMQSYIVF